MHPFADLSAYLDGALGREALASVEAHLATCAPCRTRLAELRGTARLIAALPVPVPTRSLVPRVSVPFWLAPARTLATLASGAAIFLFVASSVVALTPQGATFRNISAPLSAPTSAEDRGGAAGAAPAPGAMTNAPSPAPAPDARFATASGSPTALERSVDTAKTAAQSTATPGARQEAAASATVRAFGEPDRQQLGPSPWLWFALAIGFGATAFVMHRRLRAP